MTDLLFAPQVVAPNYSNDIFNLGIGQDFNLELGFEFRPMHNRPCWHFYYKDIMFQEVEQDFLSTFSSTLDGFVQGFMTPSKEYAVSDYLCFQEVTVDDLPAILCTIHYTDGEEGSGIMTKEIFLDKAEANIIAQNLQYALTLIRPMILHAM